jgi:PAS domain S-box-containing protein
MALRVSVFTVLLLFAATVASVLAGVAWRREATGGRAFAVMMVGVVVWCVGDAVQYGATGMSAYRLWAAVSVVGSTVVPTAALVFALQYAGFDRWMTRRSVALLAVEPAVTLLLLATNRTHNLMWRYTGEMTFEPVTNATTMAGPWWTLHLVYTYAVVAAAIGAICLFALRSRGVYRRQAGLIVLGGLVPLPMNVLWLVSASPIQGVDLSSVAFAVSGVFYAVALYRYDLLDLTPVASHLVVEDLRDGVVAVDRQGRVADVNPVARRLLSGDGEADVVGRAAAGVVPRYESVSAAGEAVDVTLGVDGEPRDFEVSASSLSDRAGAGAALLLRDVTERRRLEQRYQSLTEKAAGLIHVVEPDGTVDYVSPSVERVLGYAPGEVEGTNALDSVHPEDRADVVEKLGAIAADEATEFEAEFRARTADGEYRVLEARGRDLLDDPAVGGIVVNSRDVTRRERRERALRRQNEQLEEFAGVISHDLRNPLAVARGYVGVLEEEYDVDRLGKVVDAHERMDELLDDLLTLAREGRTVDDVAPVDLESAARMAWATVETSDATIEVRTERAVLADESRLRQLLENLFHNSVEHGGDGVTVTVGDLDGGGGPHASDAARGDRSEGGAVHDSGGSRSEPGETAAAKDEEPLAAGRSDGGAAPVGFYVADDGSGIAASDRAEVFEAGVSSDEDGPGFGLTIVRRIAEAHGWSVRLTNGGPGPGGTGEGDDGATHEGQTNDDGAAHDGQTNDDGAAHDGQTNDDGRTSKAGETGGTRFEFSEVDVPE